MSTPNPTDLAEPSTSDGDGHPRRWFPKILIGGFLFEVVNLFAVTVTEGVVQFPPLPMGRFENFAVHAVVAWLLLAGYQWVTHRSATRERMRRALVELAIVGVCLLGWRLYFEHGVRLSADSPHYFAQAHSVLFDRDLDFTNDYAHIRSRINIADRYPIGLALLSLPFLATAHLLVGVAGWSGYDLPAEGFGYPYETAFELAGYLFASLALVYLLRVVTLLLPLGLAGLSLITALLSSFLAWYMVIEPGMPHAMSFAWSTFFLGYWIQTRPVKKPRDWVVLGALIGVAALVRWQNGVLILLPLLDDALDSPRSIRPAVVTGATAALVFVPQLVFWYLTTGHAFAMPTGGHDVSWQQMSLVEVVYSTNRGLFPWNPALYLGVIGLFVWLLQSRRLAALFITGFLLQIYVNGSVGIWWAGWSFGGRRFDSCFLFFVVGLAVFFDFVRRKPLVPIAATASFLVVWNLALVDQARRGLVPPDRLVSFRDVSRNSLDEIYDRWGYPFSAPANWIFAARHGVSPEKFDRLFGHQGFGNFRSSLDSESEPYVASGWGASELNDEHGWYRWSIGRESTLLIPLKASRGYELSVDVRPFAGAVPNRVGVTVNGQVQPPQPVPAPATLRWVLDAELLKPGINVVSFYYGRTARPSDDGSSTDARELAVAFHGIRLEATPDDK